MANAFERLLDFFGISERRQLERMRERQVPQRKAMPLEPPKPTVLEPIPLPEPEPVEVPDLLPDEEVAGTTEMWAGYGLSDPSIVPANRPEMGKAYRMILKHYMAAGVQPILTSGIRTFRPEKSRRDEYDDGLHPLGYAFDVRTHTTEDGVHFKPIFPAGYLESLRTRLIRAGYDVWMEPHGTAPHLHVERSNSQFKEIQAELDAHRAIVRPLNAAGGRKLQRITDEEIGG